MKHTGSVFGGALLVAGTAIGGGMLALPVLTSLGGFFPSLVLFVVCWAFMTCTALLLLEVSLSMGGETNIVSMASRTLGIPGKVAAWLLYLFLFYTLTVAYVSGSGNLVVHFLRDSIPEWLGVLLFVAVFAPFVYVGAAAVDRVNVLLMIGLGISYIAFVALGYHLVDTSLLVAHQNWPLSLLALPVAFTSFGFQGIIPTLVTYLDYDVKRLRKAILIGSTLPLFIYIVWQWLIHGIVPVFGPGGLAEALEKNYNAVLPLQHFVESAWLLVSGHAFAFFALVTSFLGVTLGLRDFLSDGLSIPKDRSGRLKLCAMVFIPPILIAFTYPYVFLQALGYAGGFGCALLLGLMPILMAWSSRYHLRSKVPPQLPGGRLVLVLLILFVVLEIGCQLGYVVASP